MANCLVFSKIGHFTLRFVVQLSKTDLNHPRLLAVLKVCCKTFSFYWTAVIIFRILGTQLQQFRRSESGRREFRVKLIKNICICLNSFLTYNDNIINQAQMMPFQSYSYSSLQANPYASFPGYMAINLSNLQQLNASIVLMINREDKLMSEIESLRSQLQKVKSHLSDAISSIINKEFEEYMEKVKKTWEQKTYFKKDKVCTVSGCSRRYSSRIALRAHMKRKHRSLQLQTDEFHP